MPETTSTDGTTIAYDQVGSGPAVLLLHGGPMTRQANAGLAVILAEHFTVYTYDRRGRGGSAGTVEDGVDAEFEDLATMLQTAGGSAHLYGSSGAAIIALQAAARGLPITTLAVWEPPYSASPDGPRPPADWGRRIADLIAEDRRGDAVAYWMTSVIGMPAEMVAGMRHAPFWAGMESEAHGLVADHALIGDFSFDPATLQAVKIPTLVMDGGPAAAPPLAAAAAEVAATVPRASRQSLDGQPHNVADDAMAAALTAYFRSAP